MTTWFICTLVFMAAGAAFGDIMKNNDIKALSLMAGSLSLVGICICCLANV